MTTREEWEKELREERARKRRAVNAFVAAACEGDVEALANAFEEVDTLWIWPEAMRAIAKARPIPMELRMRFASVTAAVGDTLRSRVGHDLTLIAGLKALLPPYEGPAVQLYRGDAASNRKRRTYGLSWSSDQAVAESFACGIYQTCKGGSVLLETVAGSAAIICNIHALDNRYAENEYLMDRRVLGRVNVIARYPQRPLITRRLRTITPCRPPR